MDTWRKTKIMFRVSLVSAALIALHWAIWHSIIGHVPNQAVFLPSPISRWWDILIGPIWSVILILLVSNKRIAPDKDLAVGLALTMVISFLAGLISCRLVGPGMDYLDHYASFALGHLFITGLAINLVFSLSQNRTSCLVFCLAAGLAFGLAFGLVFGLTAGLIITAVAIFVVAIAANGGFILPLCAITGLAIFLNSVKTGPSNGPFALFGWLGAGMFLGMVIALLVVIVYLLAKELIPILFRKKTWPKAAGWLLAK